jgi:hypothetical protein
VIKELRIGMLIQGCRHFGVFFQLRIEAYGEDWVVGRTVFGGEAHAAAFKDRDEMMDYLQEVKKEEA